MRYAVYNRQGEFLGYVTADDADKALNAAITGVHDWKAIDVHHVEEAPRPDVSGPRGRA